MNADRSLPYYRWYVMDYRASRTYRRLNWKMRGIYRELLDECWTEGGIPDNAEQLSELLDVPLGEMAEAWKELKKHFTIEVPGTDGFYRTNSRLESERSQHDKVRAARRLAGKKGAEAKRETQAIAEQMPSKSTAIDQQMTYSSSSSSSSSKSSSKSKKQKIATDIPPDGGFGASPNGQGDTSLHDPPDSPAPDPKTKRRRKTSVPVEEGMSQEGTSWVARFGDDWKDLTGGIPNYGKIGAAVKPVVTQYGEERARTAWRRFCLAPDRKYGFMRFAEHFGDYEPKLYGVGGVLTPAELEELSR